MAPNSDPSRRDSSTNHEENPFIAFRRYADEQMASLLQSVIGLPTALTAQSSTIRWPLQEEGMSRRIADGKATPTSLDEVQKEERTTEVPANAFDTRSRSEKVAETSTMRCPYRPFEQEAQSQYSNPPKPYIVPSTLYLRGIDFPVGPSVIKAYHNQQLTTKWPLVYLSLSCYSPLYLEQQEGFREQGSKWRSAFEDLIAAQSGRDMQQDEQRYQQQTSTEWVGSMIERGLFGPWTQIGSAYKYPTEHPLLRRETTPKQPEEDSSEDEVTELDLYERFLGSQGQLPVAPASTTTPPLSKPVAKFGNDEEESSIVSTLTTTERRTMPDGTVHTKVLFKKRFVDGSEESSETTHIAQSRPTQERPPLVAASSEDSNQDQREISKDQNREKSKRGWFWS